MITLRRLWHNRKETWIEHLEWNKPLESDHILVKSQCSLISKGTESMVTSTNISPGTASKMSIPYMEGSLDSSFTYGYSLVGEVIDGPGELVDRMVHLLHPHQSYATVHRKDAFLIENGIHPESAALASNMETAVNIMWDADIQPREKALIIGFGLIGALVALVIRDQTDGKLWISDIDEDRMDLCKRLGFEVDDGENLYDLVINCSGNASAVNAAFKKLRKEGRLIECNWYGSDPVKLTLGEEFHFNRLRIISSQVSSIPVIKQRQWDFTSRKQFVFELLKKLQVDQLIEKKIQFEETPEFYRKLRKNIVRESGILIEY